MKHLYLAGSFLATIRGGFGIIYQTCSFIKMASYEGTSSTNEIKQLIARTRFTWSVLLLFSEDIVIRTLLN
jgi:hypothetical protein